MTIHLYKIYEKILKVCETKKLAVKIEFDISLYENVINNCKHKLRKYKQYNKTIIKLGDFLNINWSEYTLNFNHIDYDSIVKYDLDNKNKSRSHSKSRGKYKLVSSRPKKQSIKRRRKKSLIKSFKRSGWRSRGRVLLKENKYF